MALDLSVPLNGGGEKGTGQKKRKTHRAVVEELPRVDLSPLCVQAQDPAFLNSASVAAQGKGGGRTTSKVPKKKWVKTQRPTAKRSASAPELMHPEG